jgi:hypothetical protein
MMLPLWFATANDASAKARSTDGFRQDSKNHRRG